MSTVQSILQVVIALTIANVWLLRKDKATAYRGGGANSMQAEFAAYGLSPTFMRAVGALKLTLAVALIIGIWVPLVRVPAGLGMAALMVGAVAMHIKVGDPVARTLPALVMLLMSLGVVAIGLLA